MKTRLLLVLALALGLNVASVQAENPALTAAIFDFQTSGEKAGNKGKDAAVLLGAELSAAPNIMLIERQELEKVLGEQELSLSGTVNPNTAAKVGSLTGAKVLITGRLFEAGGKNFIVAKIISSETSRVFGEMVSYEDPAALDKAMAALAPKVAAVFNAHFAALTAAVEAPEARLERLKKSMAGAKLPSVSISVPEQHLSRPVIDPAVETELKLTLQQLGFEVVDSKANPKPADIVISGEAFSELAGRRANLISCRARVEIKAVRSSDGKLLTADRQTDVGVDLAENVAAKSALENAARKLLDRLTTKLIQP